MLCMKDVFVHSSGAAMRMVFREFDRDGNGKIEKAELDAVSDFPRSKILLNSHFFTLRVRDGEYIVVVFRCFGRWASTSRQPSCSE